MKISVSITTFNHERFIRQAIESVLAQQCRAQIEIVVGDDCSTDGTADILAQMEREHRGLLKIVRPPANLGHNGRAMFLETLKHCDGDYVAMLDGDDYWIDDRKLDTQLDFFERHPQCALCHHGVESVFEDGHTEPWSGSYAAEESLGEFGVLLPWHHIGSPAPLIRQQVVQSLPRWIHQSPFGDWPIYMAAGNIGQIGYFPRTMAAYRFHSTGVFTQASAVERQQQVVDFFAVIGGPIFKRWTEQLLRATIYHLLELVARHREAGSLAGPARDLPYIYSPELLQDKNSSQANPSAGFVDEALLLLYLLDDAFRKRNERCIARAQSALYLLRAQHLLRAGVKVDAARASLKALRADPLSFWALNSARALR